MPHHHTTCVPGAVFHLVSLVGLFLCQCQCAELVRGGIEECEILVVQPQGFTQATDVLQQSLQVSDNLLGVQLSINVLAYTKTQSNAGAK